MEIVFEKGYAIDKDVDIAVNSANGHLMLGSSGAGRIRESSKRLGLFGKFVYSRELAKLPKPTQDFYRWNYETYGFIPTVAQLSCIRLLIRRGGKSLKLGEAILDDSWSKSDRRRIIHAVGMTYRLNGAKHKRIPGTKNSIYRAVSSAVEIIRGLEKKGDNVETIAFPVIAARKSYGVLPRESLDSVLMALKGLKGSFVKKVIVCFDNPESEKFLSRLKKKRVNI